MKDPTNYNSTSTTKEVGDVKSFQQKVDDLLKVINARSVGISNDDDVEQLLQTNFKLTTNTTTSNKHNDKSDNHESTIVEDDENYDSIEEEEKEQNDETKCLVNNNNKKSSQQGQPKWTGGTAPIPSLQQQEQEQQSNGNKKLFDKSEQWNALEGIPLGKTGARMMVTFGDGPNPLPTTVQEALLAVRNCLQNAIKDARALRRQQKEDYEKSKIEYAMYRKKQSDVTTHIVNEHRSNLSSFLRLFSNKRDKMQSEPSCGFDDTQLQALFPEEMHAYKRWRSMKKAYDKSSNSKGGGEEDDPTNKNNALKKEGTIQEKSNKEKEDDEEEEDEEEEEEEVTPLQGHLEDRLAQFDARTEQMKEEWYMAFTEVRQGSFLPKQADILDKQWDEWRVQQKNNTGTKKTNISKKSEPTTWESLPASFVQFLHWVGFQPRSALPPPNEETTQALAFLGYDFMGKIIEKAIFLRCFQKMEQQRTKMKNLPQYFMLQLQKNEQLTQNDIQTALNDSTVISKPLYHATHSVLQNAEAAQLYFGPGFEERIEMEMDQMLLGHKLIKKLSQDEQKKRVQEDELFEQLKQPPKLLNDIMDVLSMPPTLNQLQPQLNTEKNKSDDITIREINENADQIETSHTASETRTMSRSQTKPKRNTLNNKNTVTSSGKMKDVGNENGTNNDILTSTNDRRKRSRSSSIVEDAERKTRSSTSSTPQKRNTQKNLSSSIQKKSKRSKTTKTKQTTSQGVGRRTRSHVNK